MIVQAKLINPFTAPSIKKPLLDELHQNVAKERLLDGEANC